ncbi:MAG: peptide deformylase [Lewinella sp.]|jgi:peptide deformylase|uniref:peptide deformylase n=1 Tax=Lewinella sp. TaxID=2004506 RepID=UPI003D6B6DBB
MLLSVYAYGQPVLKKMGQPITAAYPKLEKLIADMWETMYHANGVGLAAPQIGKAIRLFVVDTVQMMEEGREAEGIKMTFINAEKVEESGEEWPYEEGCLSIPDVRGDVERPANIRLRWVDENFEEQEATFTGLNARVIQHEYDHTDGILFTEYLKPIKKRLIKRKLENIKKGKVSADYRMKFV